MRHRLIALLLLLAFTPGCLLSSADVNQPLAAEAVPELVSGQSTADDVLLALGAPNDVIQLGKRSAWLYSRDRSKDTGLILIVFNMRRSDSRQDRIWVFFDEHDVMTHVGGTYEADGVKYKLEF